LFDFAVEMIPIHHVNVKNRKEKRKKYQQNKKITAGISNASTGLRSAVKDILLLIS
jgi:hypothetical protein